MARPLRIEFPGALYHVTARGNARQSIFSDDEDRHAFLETLAKTISRHRWICHAYCLMGNHYHLLIETPFPNLSKGMRQLNGVYTQAFNRRHKRVGHVLQGRFKAVIVEKDSHLKELCRYVVLNPVRAKIVGHPAKWEWSNYRATVGEANKTDWLFTDWMLSQFGSQRKRAIKAYSEFVGEGMKNKATPWDGMKNPVVLGTEAFVRKIMAKVPQSSGLLEIPKSQRTNATKPLAEILRDAGGDEAAMKDAYDTGQYTMKEIGKFFGVHYATVSRALRKADS